MEKPARPTENRPVGNPMQLWKVTRRLEKLPDLQLVPSCSKDDKIQLLNDPAVPQALGPMENITKTIKDFQTEYEISTSGEDTVLRQPTKRRSCGLVNTPSPCVNKAIYHIEELKVKIEKWFQQHEQATDKHVWFSDTSIRSQDKIDLLSESTSLQITGVDIIKPAPGKSISVKQDTEAVVAEIIELIWRLEADRQTTEEALKLQMKKQKKLIMKIDALSLWMLQQLPEAVQKEHEACARDITELLWHISWEGKLLEKAHSQAVRLEEVNKNLEEDINILERQRPLLDEKLSLATNSIISLQKEQSEATKVCNELFGKCKALLKFFNELTVQTNSEKAQIKQQLDDARNELKNLTNEFRDAEELWNEYNKEANRIEAQIKEREILQNVLLSKKAKLQNTEESLNDKMETLKSETETQKTEIEHLMNSCTDLEQEFATTKTDYDPKLYNLEQELETKTQRLQDLMERNENLENENDNLMTRIFESKKNITQQHTTIKNLQEDIKICDDQNKQAVIEINLSGAFLKTCSVKLQEIKDNLNRQEEEMKNTTEMLKLQISDETKAEEMAESEITELLEEIKEKKNDYKNLKIQLTQKVDIAGMPIPELEEHAEKLKVDRIEKRKLLEYYRMIKENLDKQIEETEKELNELNNTLHQNLSDVQEKYADVYSELKNVIENIEDLETKTSDVVKSKNILQTLMDDTEDTIEILEQTFETVEKKHLNVQILADIIQADIEKYIQIFHMHNEEHAETIQRRQKILDDITEDFQTIYDENLNLADEYEELRHVFLTEKDNLIEFYEKRVKMEYNLRDLKQLLLLQSKMHKASAEYFRQQGHYSQAGLANFQAASHENAQKILAVQDEMSKTIQHISDFLNTLTDGSTSEDDKANN